MSPPLTRHEIKLRYLPSPINKWWNCFLCQLWSVFQNYHRWPGLLTRPLPTTRPPQNERKKPKTNSDVIYSFCIRLVPHWIMKVVREVFFMLRSIGWFCCHNTRRISETGVWQMACHLRQRDALRACRFVCVCVQMSALLLDFSNLRDKVWETKWDIRVCVRARACTRQERKRRRVREHEYMHTGKHVRGCLIRFHTPTQKAFGACCATAHFAVTPLLI